MAEAPVVRLVALALVAVAVMIAGCDSGQAPGPDPAVADALWLPPGAQIQPDTTQPLLVRNGRSVYADGSAAVSFSLEMDCNELVGALLAQAAASEWQRRSSPLDNPQQVLPPGNTCLASADGTMGWAGEWNDHHGGVVRYAFSVQGAQGPQGGQVRGEAVFQPRDMVVRKKAS